MIYVYTAIVNGFDNLRQPAVPPEDGVRFICFTNVPNLPRVYPWEYRPIYAFNGNDSSRTSRVAKILPHLMLPPDATHSLYCDGNFQLRVSPTAMVEDLLKNHDWAAHRHPARSCIYREAEIIIRDCPLVNSDLVLREADRYRAAGYPENNALWANGMIVRRHTDEVAALNERWWKLYSAGCGRDQLSFPVASSDCRSMIHTLDENVYASPWILFRWHAAFRERDDNPDYWEQRDRDRDRLSRLAELVGPAHGLEYAKH